MSLLSVFRGLLPHSDVRPFIALPSIPVDESNTAALGNRLDPYHVSQLDLRPEVIDLTSRRMLETGWPANQ
jgi:hypothetical protein